MKLTLNKFVALALLSRNASGQHLRGDGTASVTAAAVDIPWTDLLLALSDGKKNSRNLPIPFVQSTDWMEQCMRQFSENTALSNWNLMNQPSGLCMNSAECIYQNCTGPIYDELIKPFENDPLTELPSLEIFSPFYRYDPSVFTDSMLLNDDRLNLPHIVVHPKHVGDISETLKFANKYNIGISVKSTGHSYTGSSTKKDTILLNLRKLKSYSGQVMNGSLVECLLTIEPLEEGAFADACKLAIARNKPAVIRVGGGEVWNDVLYAVLAEWNCGGLEGFDWKNPMGIFHYCPNPNKNKYHVISGASATVGAAGGWLSSGGLSANQGMRTYGLGVDQVLYVEMVLPDGRHVRFGPSEWDDVPGFIVPQTKEVTGYCNTGDLSSDDESSWVWEECEEAVDFKGLWYAVRGGGGGAYGVTTSIYYQLHDYPGQLEVISFVPSDEITSMAEGKKKMKKIAQLNKLSIEFYFRFFHMPETIGVHKAASNSCSCPDCQAFAGAAGPAPFMCYNKAGTVMIAAWKRFFGSENADLYKIGIEEELESFLHNLLLQGYYDAAVPNGKGKDSPPPGPIYPPPSIGGYVNVPLSILQSEEAVAKMIDIITPCLANPLCMDGTAYILGGDIPNAGDGMNAIPIHRRHGTLIARPNQEEVTNKLLDLFYHAEDGHQVTGNNFPGTLCHNHAFFNSLTPRKDDWTKMCSLELNDEERYQQCFTWQEATHGIENLRKLERIHSKVDPNRLFDCTDCVGYADDDEDEKKKVRIMLSIIVALCRSIV